ncbi:MAG TPA: SDR family oxidoreductase [Solirubrobacteraceae bacterium]|nr:SDR family oxidoreductase [Solirubrobacteraceae bacterium]
MHVLVAGATGHLGRALVAELRRRGHRTRALVRDASRAPAADEVAVGDAARDPLDRVVAGVDAVFSALGGTSRVDGGPRRPFRDLDTAPNVALLRAAERAGVRRFAYVSLLNADRLRGNAYVDAHEEVVDALLASPLDATIVRANGFFSAYDEVLDLARKGRARVLGDPDALSNPVHDADLAGACADALEAGAGEVEVGGPETLTRREEIELANAAAGRAAAAKRMPPALPHAAALLLRPFDPRRAAMIDFLHRVCSIDMVGPAHGERRLGDYLRERAQATA